MDLELLNGIGAVPAAEWDALVPAGEPFAAHRFLSLMEASGSAQPETGWRPLHVTLRDAGRLMAAAPMYAKGHSWGEYIFDQAWGEAYQRAGGRYYPKLLCAVPFTPVPGPRLLAVDDSARLELAAALAAMPGQLGLSSLHVNFCRDDDATLLAKQGFLLRDGVQYHWHNRGYRDFADFLDSLRSAKKKMIRKEREAVRTAGIESRALHGDELDAETLAGFYPFYISTVDKRWGNAYLTAEFFAGLATELRDQVVYVVARKDGVIVGAALNFLGGDTLYGRLWGCDEAYPFLHFECCYYAAIDFAIAHKLARVEAGAQGAHKLLRGYEPVTTHSAHRLPNAGFQTAVERFLKAERHAVEREIEECRAALPFRRGDQPEA